MLSRRLYPEAPSHKLGALVQRLRLPQTGAAHRAMVDAEMAAALLTQIQHDLRVRHGVAEPDHRFLMRLQACSRAAMPRWLARQAIADALSAEAP
jgi:DNA polymerase-3 subunit epsilon